MLDDSLDRGMKERSARAIEILPCIGRVLLEGKAVDGQFLSADAAEEILNDHLSEPFALPIVDLDHLQPVLSNWLEFQRFGQIDEIVNILLEATAAEA